MDWRLFGRKLICVLQMPLSSGSVWKLSQSTQKNLPGGTQEQQILKIIFPFTLIWHFSLQLAHIPKSIPTQGTGSENQGYSLLGYLDDGQNSFKGWPRNTTMRIWWNKSWGVVTDSSVEPGGGVSSKNADVVTCKETEVMIKVHKGEIWGGWGVQTLRMSTCQRTEVKGWLK